MVTGNIELLESNVLRDALKGGVVDPVMPVFDNIDSKVFKWAIENHAHQQHWQKDRQFAPETQRYIESVFPIGVAPNTRAFSWIWELANIPVPRGSVGYLKSIEQFLQDSAANFYPTASEYWGIPYQDDPDLKQCRWYLRLEEFNGIIPPRFFTAGLNLDPQTALPGFPYWDLPEFQDIWYPPHCSQKFPNLVIPGGFILRFFFYTPATALYLWEVMGRLRASIQSSLCVEAQYNTRINAW